MNGVWGSMEFLSLFFTWGSFLMGVMVGSVTVLVGALMVPVLYRAKRRRTLRRMWRMNHARPLDALMPTWAEYNPSDDTVDRRCVCHGRRVYAGEYVLLWPEIGPMGIVHTSVYCENVKESV